MCFAAAAAAKPASCLLAAPSHSNGMRAATKLQGQLCLPSESWRIAGTGDGGGVPCARRFWRRLHRQLSSCCRPFSSSPSRQTDGAKRRPFNLPRCGMARRAAGVPRQSSGLTNLNRSLEWPARHSSLLGRKLATPSVGWPRAQSAESCNRSS